MSALPVTSAVAGLFAILLVLLSTQTSLRRARLNAVFGDAGDDVLRRRIRAHGNFSEYAPLALIVLGLTEYHGASVVFAGTLGAAFAVSRIMHAIGMLYARTAALRAVAMLLNHASFLAAGLWLFVRALQLL